MKRNPTRFPEATPAPESAGPVPRGTGIRFEYAGRTGLTVMGPATGRTYRFNAPGAVVEVDPRDAPQVAAVPRLRVR